MKDPLDNLRIPVASIIRKTTHYESIVKNGFSIIVQHSPEDAAERVRCNVDA